jgi:hypothetical protein
LAAAPIKANAAVAQSLFRKATGDGPQSVAAAIFWVKARMGWKETVINERAGEDGKAIPVIVVPPRLNAEEWLRTYAPRPALISSPEPAVVGGGRSSSA